MEGGRLTADSKYYPQSLPVIEAEFRAAEAALSSAGATTPHPPKVDNYIEAGATIKVLQTAQTYAASQRASYAIRSGLYASMRAALHSYATDASLALELGDAAEEIFEAARRDVDVFVRSHCPAAAQQLVAINERLRDADPESLSAALTSLSTAARDRSGRAVSPAEGRLYRPRRKEAQSRPRGIQESHHCFCGAESWQRQYLLAAHKRDRAHCRTPRRPLREGVQGCSRASQQRRSRTHRY